MGKINNVLGTADDKYLTTADNKLILLWQTTVESSDLTLHSRTPVLTLVSRTPALTLDNRMPALTLNDRDSGLTLNDRSTGLTVEGRPE